MSAYYDLYETPDPNSTGEKQPLHAASSQVELIRKKNF